MKAPLSWIREYADLPADVTAEDLAHRLTALGLKLESLERPGHDITGPLVVGRVLTMEPEPQKNGKTINWCSVDVGDANGTGEPQGIVCGAHNFAVGDLVVVVLPGGVLPGGFEISARKTYGHVSAGMICSAKELGLGEDHAGIIVLPADAGEPGDDVFDLLHLRDEVHRVRDQPRPRLRPVAARCRARGGPGVRRRVPRPGRPRGHGGQRRRLPGRDRRPRWLPRLRRPHGEWLRPHRVHPVLDGAPADARRSAADLARGRRDQLRDVRAGSADPRLRRRQAHRPDRGPASPGGRATHHPGRPGPRPLA